MEVLLILLVSQLPETFSTFLRFHNFSMFTAVNYYYILNL